MSWDRGDELVNVIDVLDVHATFGPGSHVQWLVEARAAAMPTTSRRARGTVRVDIVDAASDDAGTASGEGAGAKAAEVADVDIGDADIGDTDGGRAVARAATSGADAACGERAVALTSRGSADCAERAATSDARAEVPAVSRKVNARGRTRRDRPRSKTIALKRLTREELRRGALANPPVEDAERPQTRAECADAPRPCPWVACKHHLYLDINPRTGSIKINFPDLEPWELQHTCALDIADAGALTLEEIGVVTNLTRERVRQVEVRGLLQLKSRTNALR